MSTTLPLFLLHHFPLYWTNSTNTQTIVNFPYQKQLPLEPLPLFSIFTAKFFYTALVSCLKLLPILSDPVRLLPSTHVSWVDAMANLSPQLTEQQLWCPLDKLSPLRAFLSLALRTPHAPPFLPTPWLVVLLVCQLLTLWLSIRTSSLSTLVISPRPRLHHIFQ